MYLGTRQQDTRPTPGHVEYRTPPVQSCVRACPHVLFCPFFDHAIVQLLIEEVISCSTDSDCRSFELSIDMSVSLHTLYPGG